MKDNDPEDDTLEIEVDSAGIPIFEMSLDESADTQKIILSDQSLAYRVDEAYTSGLREGDIHGQFKILGLVYEILIRAHMTKAEAADLIKIIAKHAGLLDKFELRKKYFGVNW